MSSLVRTSSARSALVPVSGIAATAVMVVSAISALAPAAVVGDGMTAEEMLLVDMGRLVHEHGGIPADEHQQDYLCLSAELERLGDPDTPMPENCS